MVLVACLSDDKTPKVDRSGLRPSASRLSEAIISTNSSPPELAVNGTILTQVSGDDDAFVEPNETWGITVPLQNLGPGAAQSVSGTLTTSTPGVTIVNGASGYSDIPQDSVGSNIQPFTFAVGSTALCGGVINFALTVSDFGGGLQTFPIVVRIGGPGEVQTFSYTGPPVPIPDAFETGGGDCCCCFGGEQVPGDPVNGTVTVTHVGLVYSVAFRIDGDECTTSFGATTVGLDHSFDADLQLTLAAPDGSSVLLVDRIDGQNFCQTVLEDSTDPDVIDIQDAEQAPFTGTFRPDEPLADLQGVNADGNWAFIAQDFESDDTGNIRKFSLLITPALCDVPVPAAHLVAEKSITGGDRTPGGQVVYTILLQNTGTATQPDNAGHELTDVIPEDLTVVNATASSGSVVFAPGLVTWDGAVIANSTVSISITADIASNSTGDVVSNQATLAFDGDLNGTNESSGVSDDPATEDPLDATVFTVAPPPQSPSTIVLVSSLNPSTYGATVRFTATVSPNTATGIVSLVDNGTVIQATPLNDQGVASFDISDLEAASHPMTAQYAGSTSLLGSTSNVVNQVVDRAATTTALASSKNPADVGEDVTLTVTVTPSRASGTVTFKEGDTVLGTADEVAGTASFVLSGLPAGTHTIIATTDFPTRYLSSSSAAVSQVVGSPAPTASTTLLELSASSPTFGDAVTLTATVAPSGVTGNVTFFDDTTQIASVMLDGNGTATFTSSSFGGGEHPLSAQYLGDGTFGGSTSNTASLSVTQAATATTLTLGDNPGVEGRMLGFQVAVTSDGGQPSGTFQLIDGSDVVTTGTVTKGSGAVGWMLSVGTHSMSARFVGTADFAASTSDAVSEMVISNGEVDAGTAGSADAGSVGNSPDAPSGSTSADAGTGASSPDARVSTTTPDAPTSSGASSGGGGCSVAGGPGNAAWLLVVGLFLSIRRRRGSTRRGA